MYSAARKGSYHNLSDQEARILSSQRLASSSCPAVFTGHPHRPRRRHAARQDVSTQLSPT